jgi:hypothetical protein
LVTQTKYDGQSNAKKKKKKEEAQDIESDEKDNASEETMPDSPIGGGGYEVDQEEGGEDEEKQDKGEATLSKDPLTTIEASQKRKVSSEKPSARKKAHANKPQLKNMLTVDDVDLIIAAIEDVVEDILQIHEVK